MLFKQGNSFLQFPVKVFYMEVSGSNTAILKAGVGVSSRNFKRAADRNRIKRLLREAYRNRKSILHIMLSNSNKQGILFFLYIAKEMPGQQQVNDAMKVALNKLEKVL